MKLTPQEAKKYGLHLAGRPRQAAKLRSIKDLTFPRLCIAHGLGAPLPEFRFHPKRKWRFDFLFPGKVAVEIVGGVWTRGHHSRGQSQIDDMERRNEAQLLGYLVLEFTPQQVDNGLVFEVIKRALQLRAASSEITLEQLGDGK